MAGIRTALFASFALALLAACAGTPPPQPEAGASGDALSQVSKPERYSDCMFARTVSDWTGVDEERLIIYGLTQSDAYLARILFPTQDLVHNIALAIVDENHDGLICGGAGDSVNFGRNATMPGPIHIVSLRKLDKAEAEMLVASAKKSKGKGASSPPAAPSGETTPGTTPAPDTSPN